MTSTVEVLPNDKHNKTLIENVHPPDWKNPVPTERYHLVAIGAGTAGLISAIGSAGLGARAALIERHLMGGDCLNVGCVPSKGVIRASRTMAEIRDADKFGIRIPDGCEADFSAVMERMRKIRAGISHEDSAERYSSLGVDVFLGDAKFIDHETIEVDGQKLKFKKCVIATGARAVVPPIDGLKEAGFRTNETIFELTELPRRMLVVGGGPIGCELAQAFQRLGSKVTIAEQDSQFLVREDPDASQILWEQFQHDGLDVRLKTTLSKVEVADGGVKRCTLQGENGEVVLEVDEILVGVGRAPNLDLNLEAAGVEYDKQLGVKVDEFLRTTNKNIFAAGDVCLKYKFTHTAEAAASIVVQNALFPFAKTKASKLIVPWCTFTHPEIAHTGKYARDLDEEGAQYETYKVPLSENNRAVLDGEDAGFVKVHVGSKGEILGATIVAADAGNMISEFTAAMVGGMKLGSLGSVIHPYPTQAEAIKRVANKYRGEKGLTEGRKKFLKFYFRKIFK